MQSCGEHTGAPSRSATAVRSDELSKRVPNEEQKGRSCRNAPEKKVAAAAIKRTYPRLMQAQLEFNDPGLHSPMARLIIFVLQLRVV